MRGLQGLMIALGLGIVGGIGNWFYLWKQASQYETVSFVAIDSTARLKVGDRFQPEHFQQVAIPRHNAGNLSEVAVQWDSRHAVAGLPATKNYRGGEILLWQDLKAPGHKSLGEMIGQNERVMLVPVDPRTFIASKVNPGNKVSFVVPSSAGTSSGKSEGSPGLNSGRSELIGPFRILALGPRTGEINVRRAYGDNRDQENVLAVSVEVNGDRLESKAERILAVLERTGYQGLPVLLHPVEDEQSK